MLFCTCRYPLLWVPAFLFTLCKEKLMKRHLNTSYRLVWNHITGTLVVASELARSRGKRAGVAIALSLAAVTSVPALAADTVVQAGETVSGGTLTNHDNQIVSGTADGVTVSTGLELGPDSDENTGYQLAKMTGNKHYQEVFARQMYNYKNVFDPSIGFMRGKGVDGKWQEPFDPLEWGGPFCEGNAWHYTWSVFHDVEGLIDLFGSDQRFTTKMDSVFTLPSTIKPGTYGGVIHEMKEMELSGMGQYAHGNQPIQHMPYLYSYAGQPWKTQYWVRQIVERLYNSTERGYPGDEDQGGMSSWYILSSLGIYAVCPGTDEYVIGSPLFKKATITMENGNKFVIEANNNSKENLYIQSATLNGRVLDKNFIRYDDIADGGIIRFEMGSQPNKERCTSKYAAPFSLSKE